MADGRFHSGASLGRELGVSRNAVWKHIRFLQQHQVDIHAVHGRGYRLAGVLELLSADAIRTHMDESALPLAGRMDILAEVDSTNRYLITQIGHGATRGDICLAEYQSAGRGRQGRVWVSPFAANIYMSLLWHFPVGVEGLAGLSMAVGASVLDACHQLGAEMVRLKWPNDLVFRDSKLAGILLELRSAADGGCHVVIGVGMNVRMPARDMAQVEQSWTDLEQVMSRRLSRNEVAASILTQLLKGLERFQCQGVSAFIEHWRRYDDLLDRPVILRTPAAVIDGIARGVDDYGALRVEHDGRLSKYLVGDVSVRARQ